GETVASHGDANVTHYDLHLSAIQLGDGGDQLVDFTQAQFHLSVPIFGAGRGTGTSKPCVLVAVNRWGDALVDEEATIEVDHLPRDIASLLGAQIRDERRHIAWRSHSAERDLIREVSISHDHLCSDERGRNGIG